MRYNNMVKLAVICCIIVILPAIVDYVNINISPIVSFAIGMFIGAILFNKKI
jgi:hypothetical protein